MEELRFTIGSASLGVPAATTAKLDAVIDDPVNWRCRTPSFDELTSECTLNSLLKKSPSRIDMEIAV
jgi:hypothetical protein